MKEKKEKIKLELKTIKIKSLGENQNFNVLGGTQPQDGCIFNPSEAACTDMTCMVCPDTDFGYTDDCDPETADYCDPETADYCETCIGPGCDDTYDSQDCGDFNYEESDTCGYA